MNHRHLRRGDEGKGPTPLGLTSCAALRLHRFSNRHPSPRGGLERFAGNDPAHATTLANDLRCAAHVAGAPTGVAGLRRSRTRWNERAKLRVLLRPLADGHALPVRVGQWCHVRAVVLVFPPNERAVWSKTKSSNPAKVKRQKMVLANGRLYPLEFRVISRQELCDSFLDRSAYRHGEHFELFDSTIVVLGTTLQPRPQKVEAVL